MINKPSNPTYFYILDKSSSEIPVNRIKIILKCLFCFLLIAISGILCIYLPSTLYRSVIFVSIVTIFTIIFITASNKKISMISAIILAISSGAIIGCLIRELDSRLPGLIAVLITPVILCYISNFIIFIFYKDKYQARLRNIIILSIALLFTFQLLAFTISLINDRYMDYIYTKGLWAILISIIFIFIENYIFYYNFKDADDLINSRLSKKYENYLVYGIIFSFISIYVQMVIFIKECLSYIFDKKINPK